MWLMVNNKQVLEKLTFEQTTAFDFSELNRFEFNTSFCYIMVKIILFFSFPDAW